MPFHLTVAHFPIMLNFFIPFVILGSMLLIKLGKAPAKIWFIVVGLQVLVTGVGYIALESGDAQEKVVREFIDKKMIHVHEDASEIFIGFTVVSLVLSIAALAIQKKYQNRFFVGLAILGLFSSYLGIRAARLGETIVEVEKTHNATPAPSADISESLKIDDNDYGNIEEDVSEGE